MLDPETKPEDKPVHTWDSQDETTISEGIKQFIYMEDSDPEIEAEEL